MDNGRGSLKVYIAAPYTKGNVGQNIKEVMDCADALIQLGYTPFIPHLTHFWHIVSPKPIEFWYNYDLEWLDICDALFRLPGESAGADSEVKYAEEHFIPVYYRLDEISGRYKVD